MNKTALVMLCMLVVILLTGAVRDASAGADADEGNPVEGWFRIDTDGLGTQFWVGATHPVGGIGLASDIYVVDTFAEFDLGIAVSYNSVSLLPMVGMGFDFGKQEAESLIAPQLFTIIDADPVYFESWIQVFFNDMFDEGEEDDFYTRNFLLYNISDQVAFGPQIEATLAIKNKPLNKDMEEASLIALPVGARLNLNYGENNTLGLFLGFDAVAEEFNKSKFAGRFTFIRTW